jgi:hypothetical protein
MKHLHIIFKLLAILFAFLSLSSLLNAYPPGWSDDILLTPLAEGYRERPDISIDRYNNVWVVWDSIFGGSGYVYYSKRDSLGNCIIPETPLPDSLTSCIGSARVVIDSADNVHIVWTEPSPTGAGIGYAKLDSSGTFIVPPKLAMPGYGGGGFYQYAIALNKNKEINIAWVEKPLEEWQISYTKLDSMGDTLISRIRISPVGLFSIAAGIGVDSFANNHFGYRTNVTSLDSLAYSKLDKNGNTLIPYRVHDTGYRPTIIADRNQNIHMVYPDPTGPGISIKYLKLNQNGDILVAPKNISIHENNNYVHMAMDSLQFLHVVWHLEVPMGVVYTKLDTLGNYVIPPMAVVDTPQAVWPGLPRIAVDHSNRLHLVWEDQRSRSVDIYYKRGENETGIEESDEPKTIEPPKLTVSPNPFTTVTRFEVLGTSKNQRPTLTIYDSAGRFVESNKLSTSTYDLGTDLKPGIYFLKLNGKVVGKVVKVK